MLIQIDAKALEWAACVYLSQDMVGMDELQRLNYDMHSANMALFNFPLRGIAKIFVFRLIYGGSAWSYAHDTDFMSVSTKISYWQEAIDTFYEKYYGVAEWHESLMRDIPKTGIYKLPTGREYKFALQASSYGDDVSWPRTTMLNYPVQGLSAQLMEIARISAYKRIYGKSGVLFINTVHDNIVLDVINDDLLIHEVCVILKECLEDVPKNFEKIYGVQFNVPLTGKLEVGHNWSEMKEYIL